MRPTAIAVASIALGALLIDAAHADSLDAQEWRRRAEIVVQFLLGGDSTAHEIIVPPGNIDPKMAFVPPSRGTMRLIVPPGEAGRRR